MNNNFKSQKSPYLQGPGEAHKISGGGGGGNELKSQNLWQIVIFSINKRDNHPHPSPLSPMLRQPCLHIEVTR